MLQGLRTVIYHVTDLDRAKAWYAEVIGHAPYFDQPFYVGFNVGGFELGLDPDTSKTTPGGSSSSSTAYWGVADADAAHAWLLEFGATPHTEVEDVGEGIRVATVPDPWGDIFGIIENPNFRV